MSRALLGSLLVGVAACGTPAAPPASPGNVEVAPAAPPVLTDAAQLADHVGEVVTLRGVQTRTKIPTVCGADVDGDDALTDQPVSATGRLEAETVEAADPTVQSRGPGTYYRLVDATTGALARPTAD